MNTLLRLLVLSLVLMSSGPVAAEAADVLPAELEPLRIQLVARELVRGQFTQEKYLAELEQPLRSSGRYVQARDLGLIWRLEQPFASDTVITATSLVQRSNGQETLRIDNGSQPGISMATQLFFALLNLDFKPLQSLFQLDWAWHDDGRFDVTLTPSDQTASRFAERILVRGSRNAGANPVEEITIDGAGDRSVIRLQAEPGPPAPLSAEERQLLTQ